MEITKVQECICFLAFFLCFWLPRCFSVDIWFVPNKTFLQNNEATLSCYARVEKFPFKHDFVFYENSRKIQDEGGAPHVVSTKKPEVYYELTVDEPARYTCKVDSKNTTAEVFKPPDVPVPVVVEAGGDANFLCPDGHHGSKSTLQINNTVHRRIETKSKSHAVLSNVGKNDVFSPVLCTYKFPSDDVIVATKIILIVVEIEVTDLKANGSSRVSCSAYSNTTDSSVALATSEVGPFYRVAGIDTVSEEFSKNTTNISCSVWYNRKSIWSKLVTITGSDESPPNGDGSGIPWFVYLIIACVILGIIILAVSCVMYMYRRCKTREDQVETEHKMNKPRKKGEVGGKDKEKPKKDPETDESKILMFQLSG